MKTTADRGRGESDGDGAAGDVAAPGKRMRAETGAGGGGAAVPIGALLGEAAPVAPRAAVQADGGLDDPFGVHLQAARGVAGAGEALPHREAIQQSFGHHDVSGVRAHVGGEAKEASSAIGASAYATGNDVAFAAPPDLRLAAHEAAHVVQQAGGVQLSGGVGASGDAHERHADEVAERVVRGESAAALLDAYGTGAAPGVQRAVQRHDPDAGVPDAGPNDGGALPGGLPPAPDQERVMRGEIPWTGALAETILGQHTARGEADRAAWYASFEPHGQMTSLLAHAPAADAGAGGRYAAGALDVLRRMGAGSGAAIAQRLNHQDLLIEWALAGQTPWTAALAQRVLEQHAARSPADRATWFARWYPRGQLPAMMRAAPNALVIATGVHNTTVQDLLQRIQVFETDATAASVGLTDHAGLVAAQAAHLQANPNLANVHSVHHRPPPLTPAQIAAIDARLAIAIPRFIAHVNRARPELPITAADVVAATADVQQNGDAIAQAGQRGGRNVAEVGRPFAEMVEADPAYAVPTVVHELYGHNEYGPYGDPGSENGLTIFDEAVASAPAFHRDRNAEVGSFAYQESEIYSLLREVPYYTPNAPAHAHITDNYSPESGIRDRLRVCVQLFEARVLVAHLRGLYRRLRADPRLAPPGPDPVAQPGAIGAFQSAVRAQLPAQAAQILQ